MARISRGVTPLCEDDYICNGEDLAAGGGMV
jgi:hypothetical protein